ncbi:heavy metal translocating P-type ATPase [Ralstonia pickettii]|nr:heavy metal translocating P-type ATPase [Ralstonia pickettii]
MDFNNKSKQQIGMQNKFVSKLNEHIELIAALISGFIILITWLLKDDIPELAWVILHLSAFTIGGFAKAKEGITETINTKKLNVEFLMIIAAIGSATIGYWTEGAILIFIFALSGALETYTLNKSNKAISSLMELQPEEALLLQNGQEKIVPVKNLKIGDHILVKAGERIPIDGIVIKGHSAVDESAITGESIPINKFQTNEVLSGTVALDGTLVIQTTTKPNETLFQKIIQLVQTAQEEKSPSQLFIEKFENIYVYSVLLLVIIMMFLPYLLFDWSLTESIYRAMVLLVVASPCALVASISPATLSAVSNAAKNGVLVKGGINLENLSSISVIAFDKTGTLTNGKPTVTDAIFSNDMDADHIMQAVGSIEKESIHPLAQAITAYCKTNTLNYTNFEIKSMRDHSGKGVSALLNGVEWKIGKADFVGREQAEVFSNQAFARLAAEGKTVTFAKAGEDIVALFALKDTIRDSSKEAIALLKEKNIEPVMLTGDNPLTAQTVAEEIGIKQYEANCLPEDKVKHIKNLRKKDHRVAMVGDGINDAPALASANVGVAMGEGTDIALETADVILMKNDINKFIDSIKLSGRMNRIVKQNIFFSLAVIIILITSNYFQMIDLPLGVIGHEGSTILVILNGLRLLK